MPPVSVESPGGLASVVPGQSCTFLSRLQCRMIEAGVRRQGSQHGSIIAGLGLAWGWVLRFLWESPFIEAIILDRY